MKKVMVFESCDSVENQHERLLRAATEHGDSIMVVVARDASVGDDTADLTADECARFAQVMAVDVVDDVILAHGDYVEMVRVHTPHIVLVGAHQKEVVDTLSAHSDVLRACGCVMVHV